MKNKIIPYGKQFISQRDLKAVAESLRSNFLTQGPKIPEFEKCFAKYVGANFAIAVSNGTAALHLSALALKVQPGQKIITTPITFAASANCIKYCGGEVVFADIDPVTYLLDINKVRKILESSPKGTFAGIIVVDFAGRTINTETLNKLAWEYGIWIIEDACHAVGGFFIDSVGTKQYCGNGTYVDLTVFSFHPVKHLTTGEGGMITTNDKLLYKKLIELRSHGITRDSDAFVNDKIWAAGNAAKKITSYPGWYMEMQELGFNYRITDFQSALGISQLNRVNKGLKRRREIAKKYAKAFRGKKWLLGQSGIVQGHAYHLYIIEVKDRLGLYNYLRSKNIFAQVHYIPTHLMPYYRQAGYKEGDFPNAEKYYSSCLSLPMYATLSKNEQLLVIDVINEFYRS